MTRTQKLVAFIVVAGIAAVSTLALTRRPVLFSFTDPGELQQPSFTVFNPLRDKSPERAAEAVLTELQRGDASAAFKRVHVQGGVSAEVREKERAYPLRKWKLATRKDTSQQVVLVFRTARTTAERFDSPVVMAVERRGGEWLVTDFDPIY